MTCTSRTSLACTSTRATPGTREKSGRIWYCAMSYRVGGSPPSRLYDSIGKSDGVMRSTSISSPAGSSPMTRFTRACVCSSADCMSVSSANVMFTSVPPRMARDCTRVTPATTLTASSMGRVMLNSTCRAPSAEPFTTTVMRENTSSG